MSIFKCKMCGGDLEASDGAAVVECEYCGTKQTVPKSIDENMQNLFNRANTLRIKGEFDKAERLYEKIVQSDETQSEAYWGLILCKYGIEYVDDPTTFKKVPTCHRASYDSIIADDDYKSALANADLTQKAIYEEQAREIDRIQKDILSLSQKEEKYDVFICYKETDANGQRTQDSVIANDSYYQLKNEGFKVFYAAITLEGKLGSAYEPIIFAALNSAKVMLAIGTKPEYFNAVWVKNEWSRFLKIVKKDRSKLLIPCYRDMDAYELPEEFAHLQAQDMSKIGFINDIVRGIKKVVVKNEPAKAVEAPKAQNNSFDALIKRIYLLLEDGDFNKADELCEQVLNGDPENAEAYICKMLIEFKCHTKDKLFLVKQSITNSKNCNKVLRFGNDEQIAYVKSANDKIQVTLQKIREEECRKAEELRRQQAEELKRKQEEESKRAEELKRIQEEIARRESSAGLEFELNKDGKGYTLTKVGNCKEKNIVIDMHKGLPITIIGVEAFCDCKNITSIIIPNSVTNIGERAFSRCSNLTSIIIPNSVTSIGDGAFYGCENLTNITIPNSVTSIGAGAFYGCENLTNITIPNSVTSIGGSAFYSCKNLTSITIPNSVTSIGEWAFSSCENLTTIIIPNSVTSIGDDAFWRCENLTSIIIPNSVTSIGKKVFCCCTNLTSITITNSVTSIGESAFSWCKNLTNITIPNSVTSIGERAFSSCENLTSITMLNSVTSIGKYAFSWCKNLTSITIPNSVTSIGINAFLECKELKYIYCFDNFKNIEGINNARIRMGAVKLYYSESKPSKKLFNRYWHYVDGVPTEW